MYSFDNIRWSKSDVNAEGRESYESVKATQFPIHHVVSKYCMVLPLHDTINIIQIYYSGMSTY